MLNLAFFIAAALAGINQTATAQDIPPIRSLDILIQQAGNEQYTDRVISPDVRGRIRFDLNPGTYRMEARLRPDNPNAEFQRTCPPGSVRVGDECFVLDSVALSGVFSHKTSATGNPVVGPAMDGSTLTIAATPQPDGGIFTTNIEVSSPVAFTGLLRIGDPISIRSRHLVFYQVSRGPQAAAQNVTLHNGTATDISYTASFQAVGASSWTSTLSKESGSISPFRTDTIALRPPPGLAEGQYDGFLRIRFRTPSGSVERVSAVTLFVQSAEASKAAVLIKAPGNIYPNSSGTAYEPGAFTITNNSNAVATYTLQSESEGITFTPRQLRLEPGASGEINGLIATRPPLYGLYKEMCVRVNLPDNGSMKRCFLVWADGWKPNQLSTCTPSSLQPGITSVSPTVARLGFPLNAQVKVYDNCGNPVTGFTAALSVNNGVDQSHLLSLQSRSGPPIAAQTPPSKVSPAARIGLPDAATEISVDSFLYPYFYYETEKKDLFLKVSVTAPNPAGGDELQGSAELPLIYDFDAGAPLLAQDALVNGSTFALTPIAPFSEFALFALLPDLADSATAEAPFPAELAGVRILIDGVTPAPLIRVTRQQINAIVPDLPSGTHIASVLYNNRLSGAITFEVAEADPSPVYSDLSTGTPQITDGSGLPVTRDNPLTEGQIFTLYSAGMGRMKGLDQSPGAPTPGAAMQAELPCSLTVGQNSPTLLYCGRVPASVSLDQVIFQLPSIATSGVEPGDVIQLPIHLDMGDHQGARNALVWVRAGSRPRTTMPLIYATIPGGLTYSVGGVSRTGVYGPAIYNIGDLESVDVPQPVQPGTPGTQWVFTSWSSPLPSNQPAVLFGVNNTLPPVLFARFSPEYRLTTIGAIAVNVPSNGSSQGFYRHGQSVTVTGSCGPGAPVLGLIVQKGMSNSVIVPNGSTITMDQPVTVTVQCGIGPALTACVTPPSGLLGWWPLDELSGTNAANRGSQPSANGTYTSNPTAVLTGRVAAARNFSSGGFVSVTNATAFNFPATPSRAFSIDAWVRGTGLGVGLQHVVMKHTLTSAGSAGYGLGFNNGKLLLHLHDSSNRKQDAYGSHPPVNDGNWHLIAATVDFAAQQGFLYFDGIVVGSFIPDPNLTDLSYSQGLLIGPPAGGVPFAGQIDEVEIFNRALPATSIQDIFRAGAFGKCKTIDPQPLRFSVTISGCNSTFTSSTAPVNGQYTGGSQITVTANPPTGALVNITVTDGLVTTTYNSSPITFTLNRNVTITVACTAKPSTCIDPPPGMVGWYSLDESAGPLKDSTPNPADLTVARGAGPDPNGKVAGAWRFSNGGLLTNGSPAKFNFATGDFAIDLWLKFFGGQPVVPLVTKMNTAGSISTGFGLYTDNGVLRLDLASNGAISSWKGTKQVMLDKLWHHVVVNVSRTGGVTFIVDGLNDPFTANPPMVTGSLNNTNPLQVGGVELTIDEVELFNRTLSLTEAQTLFLADSNGKCKSCPGTPNDALGSFALESASNPVADSNGTLTGNNTGTTGPLLNQFTIQSGVLTSITGKKGNGLKFPASPHSAIKLGSHPDLADSAHEITVMAYVKLAPGEPGGVVFGRHWPTSHNQGRFGGSHGYHQFSAGPAGMGITITDGNQGTSGNYPFYLAGHTVEKKALTVPADNNWHCVGYRIKQTPSTASGAVILVPELKMFVDGDFATFTTTTTSGLLATLSQLPTANAASYIGWDGIGNPYNYFFQGSMDEVNIFNRALSEDEMKAMCGICQTASQNVSVLVNTAVNGTVINAGLTIGVDGTNYTNSHSYSAPGGSSHLHTAAPTQIANGSYYTFQGWSPGGSSGIQNVTLPSSGPVTYTANYTLAGYVVTVANTPSCSVNVGPSGSLILTNPLVFPIGTTLTVTAGNGNPTGFTVSLGGGAPNLSFGVLPNQIGPFGSPITITPTCATAIVHTVTTSPAALQVRIDSGSLVTAPQSATWNAGTAHQLGTQSPQLNSAGDTQYTFINWTATGGAAISNASSVNASVPSAPTTPTTYTANFSTAYKVTLNLTGSCTAESSTPGLGPGPSSVFVPAGSSVGVTVSPGDGQVILSASRNGVAQQPRANGTVGFAIVGVNGPENLTVNCGRPRVPNLVYSFVSRSAASGLSNGVNVVVRLTNNGSAAANNVQITQITSSSGTLINTTPISVGTIPPGQSQNVNLTFGFNGPPPATFNVQAFWSFTNPATGSSVTGTGSVTAQ